MKSRSVCDAQSLTPAFEDLAKATLVVSCEDYLRQNECSKVRDQQGARNQNAMFSCEVDHLCESQEPVDKLQCTFEGIQVQFSVANLVLLIGASAAQIITRSAVAFNVAVMVPPLVFAASESEQVCNKDLKYKRIVTDLHNSYLLKGERPLDIDGKDQHLLKMPCSDLRRFVQNRLDTLAGRRLEARRWSSDDSAPPISKALLETVNTNRCFKQSVVTREACHAIAGLLTGITAGSAVSSFAKKVIAARASSAEGPASAEKTAVQKPETSGRTAEKPFQRQTPARNAVERELPRIPDRDTFAEEFQKTRKEWNSSHPENPNNFPMSVHKDAMDFLKNHLSELKKTENLGARDQIDRRLNDPQKKKVLDTLLHELDEVEKKGYPHQDTLALGDRIVHFLTRIENQQFAPEAFISFLNKKYSSKIELTTEEQSRISDQKGQLYREATAPDAAKIRKYEADLISTVQKSLKSQGKNVSVREELRVFDNRVGFDLPPEKNIVYTRSRVINNEVVVLTADVSSIRGIAEATLFKTHIAGAVKKSDLVDGNITDPSSFLEHDLNHINRAIEDPISVKLMNMSTPKKIELLNKIDAIANTEKKELAEFALMAAVREFPTEAFFSNLTQAETIFRLKTLYKVTHLKDLSPKDSEWVLQWWNQNLPTH